VPCVAWDINEAARLDHANVGYFCQPFNLTGQSAAFKYWQNQKSPDEVVPINFFPEHVDIGVGINSSCDVDVGS
jgi:hypothetical protein